MAFPCSSRKWPKAVLGGGNRGRSTENRRSGSIPDAGSACKPPRLADGAARPARACEGGGADRGGNQKEFSHSLLAAVAPKPEAELGASLDRLIAAGLSVTTRRAATGELPVQACAGAGRCLWHAIARSAPRASQSHRRNA